MATEPLSPRATVTVKPGGLVPTAATAPPTFSTTETVVANTACRRILVKARVNATRSANAYAWRTGSSELIAWQMISQTTGTAANAQRTTTTSRLAPTAWRPQLVAASGRALLQALAIVILTT